MVAPLGLHALDELCEQDFKPLRSENMLFQLSGHQIIEQLHRYGASRADALAFEHGRMTTVIAVLAALARHKRQPAAACRTLGNASQQDRTVDHARRRFGGTADAQLALHLVERFRLNDDRAFVGDPFAAVALLAGAPVLLPEIMRARISLASQDFMDARGSEFVPAEADALAVQLMRDDAHAHAGQIHIEDRADDLRLCRVDFELLLVGVGSDLHRHGLVAERGTRTVPEATARVRRHCVLDHQPLLFAVILVHRRHDLAQHPAARIVRYGLRDGNQHNIVRFKRAAMQLKLERVTEKARVAVNKDRVIRMILARRIFHHSQKLRALVVRGGRAGFDIFGNNRPALLLAARFKLTALFGDRQVLLCLPRRRNPQIKSDLHCLISFAFAAAEKIGEPIAQFAFQQLKFFVCNREQVREV